MDSVTHCSDPSSGQRHSFQQLDVLVGDDSQLCPSPGVALTCSNKPAQGYPSSLGTAHIQWPVNGGHLVSRWHNSEGPFQLQRSSWDQRQSLMHLHHSQVPSIPLQVLFPKLSPLWIAPHKSEGFRDCFLGSLSSDHLKADYVIPLLKILYLQTTVLTP